MLLLISKEYFSVTKRNILKLIYNYDLLLKSIAIINRQDTDLKNIEFLVLQA